MIRRSRLLFALPGLLGVLLFACSPAQEPGTPEGQLAPLDSAAQMTVPEGFRVTLFAAEPDVVQPIGFTIDGRGRLWVVECTSYPDWRSDGTGNDRVLIFEDTDGDGRHDRRTVFLDGASNLSGIELGFGGVWLCSTPNLLFVPDRDRDDRPDGPPQVMLDGWDLNARHNVFNGLTWGPDGWLYGTNGIVATSHVGKPGTPDDERTPLNCGVWRYHPTRHEFEPVAWGTTNPWGLDFDELGQMFITNCVIPHVFHAVPGAHFQRMHSQDLNPNVYGLLETCADHLHWAGGFWKTSIGGKHGEAGGGHAHAGAMVYLGDNWPQRYRNGLFMVNIHGQRVNHDRLERQGSGYVARHEPDFLQSGGWFRGLELKYGPDGGVFLTDWNDTGECHDYVDTQRGTGRIYKVTYGDVEPVEVDLDSSSDLELVDWLGHANQWYVRQSQRRLQERAAAGKLDPAVRPKLRDILAKTDDLAEKLASIWTLHVTGGLDDSLFDELLTSPEAYLRGWAVQLECEDRQLSARRRSMLAKLAADDPSPVVRLYLASSAQRLPADDRWPIVEALAAHGEDAADANLPLMVWYATEPLVPDASGRDVALLASARLGIVREYAARRMTGAGDDSRDRLIAHLAASEDTQAARDVVSGMYEALKGSRDVPMPAGWTQAYAKLSQSPNNQVREKGMALALIFGDREAASALREVAADRKADVETRKSALEALLTARSAEMAPLVQSLLDDQSLRRVAIRGLAGFDDPSTPSLLVARYASLTPAEQQESIATLAARPEYATALLDAMEGGTIPPGDVPAYVVSALVAYNDAELVRRLNDTWGTLRETSDDRTARKAELKRLLNGETLAVADVSHGRRVFAKTCAACHRLFDDGAAIGPELTGSQRANLDYVLDNLVDPSAVVANEYRTTTVVTTSGRLIQGVVAEESDRVITLQTTTERVLVPRDEIDAMEASRLSLMPEGQLDRMTDEEIRDLVAYLAAEAQVPLSEEH